MGGNGPTYEMVDELVAALEDALVVARSAPDDRDYDPDATAYLLNGAVATLAKYKNLRLPCATEPAPYVVDRDLPF